MFASVNAYTLTINQPKMVRGMTAQRPETGSKVNENEN